MVGVIQKILLDLIRKHGGDNAVNQVLKKSGLPENFNFRIDKVYSDEQCRKLFSCTLEVLGIDEDTALKLYAEEFCLQAKALFPVWFKMSKNSFEFLSRQPQIHNNFATGVTDIEARKNIEDKFRVERLEKENKLITHYKSENKFCNLYKKLAEWIIDFYQDVASISEIKCMHKGDPECEIHIEWDVLHEQ